MHYSYKLTYVKKIVQKTILSLGINLASRNVTKIGINYLNVSIMTTGICVLINVCACAFIRMFFVTVRGHQVASGEISLWSQHRCFSPVSLHRIILSLAIMQSRPQHSPKPSAWWSLNHWIHTTPVTKPQTSISRRFRNAAAMLQKCQQLLGRSKAVSKGEKACAEQKPSPN